MLFNSLSFLIFLPIVLTAYFALAPRHRWILLLAASYYFYMCWKVEYVLLIIASTLVDYVVGLKMGDTTDLKRRRWLLGVSLVVNLGILFAFKYLDFFGDSVRQTLAWLKLPVAVPELHLLLPVGISFYTFQTLSYSIEVYRGHQKPERRLGIFALYVSFFPQLVAGPIERSVNLLPQFDRVSTFDYERFRRGLLRIAWGMFKKVVVADRVAVAVNAVYNDPAGHSGIAYILATVLFAYQIYCDFSGYSDIAIGTAELFGIRLMQNFDNPYYAKSIAEFWKRWHISLSTWFRDYLYIALGGNRRSVPRWYANLAITFLISGLWHGAAWTFVVWGGLNGLYLIAEILLQRPRKRLLARLGIHETQWRYRVPAVLVTFTLTCFAWIFFRANSMSDALHITRHLADGVIPTLTQLLSGNTVPLSVAARELSLSRPELLAALGAIASLELIQFLTRGRSVLAVLELPYRSMRWSFYYALLLGTLLLGAFNRAQEFIYFQF